MSGFRSLNSCSLFMEPNSLLEQCKNGAIGSRGFKQRTLQQFPSIEKRLQKINKPRWFKEACCLLQEVAKVRGMSAVLLFTASGTGQMVFGCRLATFMGPGKFVVNRCRGGPLEARSKPSARQIEGLLVFWILQENPRVNLHCTSGPKTQKSDQLNICCVCVCVY